MKSIKPWLRNTDLTLRNEMKRGKPRTFAPDDVVKEFFASADKDGDGMASRSEWNAARPTWKWLFDHMDKDKNGQLDRTGTSPCGIVSTKAV